MNAAPPEILSQIPQPDSALLAGIAAYRRHPYQRDLPDPPVIWSEGGSRLLDYGGSGRVVFFVPSLVNRATILDLREDQSMLRYLAAHGVHPLLLDWGWPDELERGFSLTDYIAGRLERALMSIDKKVVLAGYCMGGVMALAAALRRPDLIDALALLATPWDFHAASGDTIQLVRLLALFEPAMSFAGALPVDALQLLFALLDPGSVAEKYRNFANQNQNSARANMFVAIEDWLNDGVPLAAPVARETIAIWYGANATARGEWLVAGAPVRPEKLKIPVFLAAPRRDRIVPAESAVALAQHLPQAVLCQPRAGHVGMVAGTNAAGELWDKLLAWLATI